MLVLKNLAKKLHHIFSQTKEKENRAQANQWNNKIKHYKNTSTELS